MHDVSRRAVLLYGLASLSACGGGGGGASPTPGSPTPTPTSSSSSTPLDFDVVIYGSGLGGLAALLRAAGRRNKRVCVIEPRAEYGGSHAAGLTPADYLDRTFINGEVLNSYFTAVAAISPGTLDTFAFEPKAALTAANQIVGKNGAFAIRNAPLNPSDVILADTPQGRAVQAVKTASGLVTGKVFIDASYEGDLMAGAVGPSGYVFGRESRQQYGESRAGYVGMVPSFTYPGFSGNPPVGYPYLPDAGQAIGSADDKVQAYNFRLALTRRAANRLPFIKPSGYSLSLYATELRLLAKRGFVRFARASTDIDPYSLGWQAALPNGKISWNAFDLPNGNIGYADGDWATRRQIVDKHLVWQQGLMWAIANDPGVADYGLGALAADAADCGLCQDEFVGSQYGNGWPFWLYVREGRRLKSIYFMTERDLTPAAQGGTPTKTTSIGKWRYAWDIHAVQGLYTTNPDATSTIFLEGPPQNPRLQTDNYQIPAECMLPPKQTCVNLIVPVCSGFSHAAWSAQRLEVPFGICGEAAGEIAAWAVDAGQPVQNYDYASLASRLQQFGSVL